MKIKKFGKKGFDALMENLIFIIVIALFFGVMFAFVARAGSQANIIEQVYSKQVALLIDKMNSGMTVNLDISELNSAAKRNKFYGKVVDIDNKNKKVNVQVVGGKGYSFNFFSDDEIIWNLKENKLYLEVR